MMSFLVFHREMYGRRRIARDNLAGFQLTVRHIYACHRHGTLDGLVSFCLDTHAEQGNHCDDNGFKLHIA